MQHIPVLLDAVIDSLLPTGRTQAVERVIDGTLGAGGHTRALLAGGVGAVLGLDRDPAALAVARANLAEHNDKVYFVHASYGDIESEAHRVGWESVDAILLDLGLSSLQLETAERGFAIKRDGPLDMRFDPTGDRPPAEELVNYLDEAELADLLYKYGEERYGRRLAREIVRARPIHTTGQLATVIEEAMPRPKGRSRSHAGNVIHPATRTFQALRIAVNDELPTLERTLPLAIDLLKSSGRLAVITFHSLEDRIVKHAFRQASTEIVAPPGMASLPQKTASIRLVNRKPIVATADEIVHNPRSRSAKLRVIEKLEVR